jgi:hypothetical protein
VLTKEQFREKLKPLFAAYITSGKEFSPMNTESCRKYLQEECGENVEPEDVLWLFYHTDLRYCKTTKIRVRDWEKG